MENQQNKEGDNLLRIKEILFGEDLQDVEKRLQELKSGFAQSLKEFQADIEDTISDLKTKQEKNAFMIQEVNQKKLHELKAEFSEQLTSLKGLLENQNEIIDQKLSELRNSQVSKKELSTFLEEIIQKLK